MSRIGCGLTTRRPTIDENNKRDSRRVSGTIFHKNLNAKVIEASMDLRRLLGYSKITFHFHEDPLPLRDRDGDETDFLSICRSITPACWLNPLLFNGHLQTTWTVVKGRDPLVYYKRKIFEAENPAFAGTFAVDFVVQPHADTDNTLPPRTVNFSDGELEMIGSKDEKPMLLTLHGLTGGSQEAYLKHVPESLFKEGWEACVVNARGCAQSKITTGFLFNARATWDVRQVVKWLRDKFPNRPLFAIGYSLGANILANVRSRSESQHSSMIMISMILILHGYSVVPW